MKYALLGVLSVFILFLGSLLTPSSSVIYGYIEADFIKISPSTSGILKELSVKRGSILSTEQPLFSLDLTDIEASIQGAKSQIARLQAQAYHAQREYGRILRLQESGASTEAKLDDATTSVLSFTFLLEEAQQHLKQLTQKLAEAAPLGIPNALVQETYYLPGEFVPAGKPVVSLLIPENIKVRFFVPQSMLSKLSVGQPIHVWSDGNSAPIPAEISFISSKMEYTPPVIYSVESRSKLVALVEAKPCESSPLLHPGLPVSIVL